MFVYIFIICRFVLIQHILVAGIHRIFPGQLCSTKIGSGWPFSSFARWSTFRNPAAFGRRFGSQQGRPDSRGKGGGDCPGDKIVVGLLGKELADGHEDVGGVADRVGKTKLNCLTSFVGFEGKSKFKTCT
uniref:(northern house mosquito) hypothetical protein n=1 Tax=Culex pipiens TaxID=7175 RepID=A0A8D8G8R9_CULPI